MSMSASRRRPFLYVADIMSEMEEYYSTFLENDTEKVEIYPKSEYMGKPLSIDELIQEGQELLVQVSKDHHRHEGGARVTSYVTLPGRYIDPHAERGARRHFPPDRE
ncbi:MAG: hypothetical protein MZV70_01205 [Desulfobacterales bacterium]|nr:hypothetical protein [Desulfobacterales bacterium]